MRVKVFSSGDSNSLERAVNDWLEENEDKVVILSTQLSSAGRANSITFSCQIAYSPVDKIFKEIDKSPVD